MEGYCTVLFLANEPMVSSSCGMFSVTVGCTLVPGYHRRGLICLSHFGPVNTTRKVPFVQLGCYETGGLVCFCRAVREVKVKRDCAWR